MAVTALGVNHPLAVKIWATRLQNQTIGRTYLKRFMGTGMNSMIRVLDQPSKGAGDRVTYGLRRRLTGDGVTEGEELEGAEEALTFDDDSLVINELDHAVKVNNRMTQQRVNFDVRDEAGDALEDWYVERLETTFFNQLVGNTEVATGKFSGFNPISAPTLTANANDLADADAVGADDTATATLPLLRRLKQKLILSRQAKPVRYQGKNWWVGLIHPFHEDSIKEATGANSWIEIQKALLAGGQSEDDNNVFTGAVGVYDNIIIHVSEYMPQGIGAGGAVANTRKLAVCGACAAHIAFGKNYNNERKFNWVEKPFDYDRELGVSAQTIMGMKKTRFNNADFAVATGVTYTNEY